MAVKQDLVELSSGMRCWLSEAGQWTFWLLIALLGTAAARPLLAQATAPVPLDDPSYPLLDRLSAQLPTSDFVHDQRPYTRAQIARLTMGLRDAHRAMAARVPPTPTERLAYLDELLAALEERFAEEIGWLDESAPGGAAPRGLGGDVDRLRLEASLADSPFRGLSWNGLGFADNARVNPLLDHRFGRALADGASAAFELEGRGHAGARLVVFGGPRVEAHAPRGDPDSQANVSLRSGALRLDAGRWAFQIGRAAVRRGQGRHTGMIFSDNAPPLDMVLVENEEPLRLPWLFSRLGPLRFSALLADLGPEQNFPHAKLYSNWLTFRSADRFEVGGGFIVQDGGEGSPRQSVWRRLGDHLLFVDAFFPESNFEGSNKIAGLDLRWWAPGGVAVLYGEIHFDDVRVKNWTKIRETVWADAAHALGVTLPSLDGVGKLSGWMELQHTGVRMYRHYDFSSGVTSGRFLLGSGMGSNARAMVAGLDYAPSASSALALEAAFEMLSHDEWIARQEPFFHFEKVRDGPEERRTRILLAWERRPLDAALGWRIQAGAEQVRNFGFELGATRSNAALQLAVEWSPR
jgi:hypothetical protein